MIHLLASVRVYLCLAACDMRRTFDGLAALVRGQMELDQVGGHYICVRQPAKGTGEIPHTDQDLWLSSTAGIRFTESDCRYIGAHRSVAVTMLFTLKQAWGFRTNCPRG